MKYDSLWLLPLFASTLLACGPDGSESTADQLDQAPESPSPALPPGAQALSLMGEPLFPPELSEEGRARLEGNLEEALADLQADPEGADALIWAGRRHAYLGDYRRAIEIYSQGIELHPDDARFFRHRGHRYISVREFDNAIADFSRAAELVMGTEDEVEPDGAPNALGIPTSTLQFNIWYHFGLAHYLKGEFQEAIEKYEECMDVSAHPDSKVATAHWWYMSLRRTGQEEEARELIEGMDLDALEPELIESTSYFRLLRLYATAGDPDTEAARDPQDMSAAALGYGYGAWKLYNGDEAGAREIFENLVAARNQWASFGFIAAEADLARMGGE